MDDRRGVYIDGLGRLRVPRYVGLILDVLVRAGGGIPYNYSTRLWRLTSLELESKSLVSESIPFVLSTVV